ncbi:MAG: DUF4013 domain-containing protein [Planctomycetes bacterium]|nr:DUF4013 domain-containing protein [Planctomycetota bacterium]
MSEDSDYEIDSLPTSLDCMRSYQFITENPNWMQNVLLVAVCNFIPIIGPLLIQGYQFEVAESLLYEKRRRTYVDFTFDRFTDYLVRGVWPFLVALIGAIVLMPVMIVGWFASILILGLIGGAVGNDAGGILVGLGMGTMFFLLMLLMIGFNILMIPLTLRAGYSQDLGRALDLTFARDFLRLMWKDCLIAMLFLMISSIPLMLVGFLLCFVGVYFTIAIFMMAQAHLLDYQLYAIYLSRGGTPIPRKVEASREDSDDEDEDDESDDE